MPDDGHCRLCQRPLAGQGEGEFCCTGCARVHAVIAGLDEHAGAEYLKVARGLGLIPGEATLPTPAPLAEDPEAMREERFRVEGMSCPSCSWVIERVLASQAGVASAQFDFLTGSGCIRYDMRRTSPDQVQPLLRRLGYALTPVRPEKDEKASRAETLRFVICAVLSMNLMSLSVVRYSFDLGWIDALPTLVAWLELALCVPVVVIGLNPILRRAFAGLRQGRLTMDALIGLSVLSAFGLSVAAMAAGRDEIYFETAAGLVTIALLSRTIEARLRARAIKDTATLMHLEVARSRLAEPGPDGRERFILVGDVTPGTRLCFRAGELIPFDGRAENPPTQACLVSEAVLTGEPTPLRKLLGDVVTAGSVVGQGELFLRVERSFHDTRLSGIARSLRGLLAQRESRLRASDRIAAWFVPAVFSLAVVVWLVRLATHGLAYALSAKGWFPSVAVLAVACPCAFSLAGASAIMAGNGALFARGFLVRDLEQLERLHACDTVVFDKTGTLTLGQVSVEGLVFREGAEASCLSWVLAAEMESEHPVGRAIRQYLLLQGIAPALPADGGQGDKALEDLPGQGRRVRLPEGDFAVGAATLFPDRFTPAGASARQTLAWFGRNGRAEGCFLVSDTLRPGAPEVVAALVAAGMQVHVLSGDRQAVCEHLRSELGATRAQGDATLEAKVAYVGALESAGRHVAFIGDGTNDALAMSSVTASVAIAGATDEALHASGFVLLHPGLFSLPHLFSLARRLRRVIRNNYFWAFGFNGLFIPIAAAGVLTPIAAMLLMLFSSTAVLLNSLSLNRGRGDLGPGKLSR